jgi:hypothetical protein
MHSTSGAWRLKTRRSASAGAPLTGHKFLFSAWTRRASMSSFHSEAIIANDLAADVTDDAAEIGLQGFERPPRPLELLGMA